MSLNQSFVSYFSKYSRCTMVDVGGDVLRPPHCTTPAAVKAVMPAYTISSHMSLRFKWANNTRSSENKVTAHPKLEDDSLDQSNTQLATMKMTKHFLAYKGRFGMITLLEYEFP